MANKIIGWLEKLYDFPPWFMKKKNGQGRVAQVTAYSKQTIFLAIFNFVEVLMMIFHIKK